MLEGPPLPPREDSIVDVHSRHDIEGLQWRGTEQCGIVLQHKGLGSINWIELPNLSPSPRHFFEMSGTTIARYKEMVDYEMVGFWHTHPPKCSNPSSTDMDWSPEGYEMHIICDGRLKVFDKQGKWIR